jgi:hypothetical protein
MVLRDDLSDWCGVDEGLEAGKDGDEGEALGRDIEPVSAIVQAAATTALSTGRMRAMMSVSSTDRCWFGRRPHRLRPAIWLSMRAMRRLLPDVFAAPALGREIEQAAEGADHWQRQRGPPVQHLGDPALAADRRSRSFRVSRFCSILNWMAAIGSGSAIVTCVASKVATSVASTANRSPAGVAWRVSIRLAMSASAP